MNIYNTIKAAVTTRQAAEHFGLAVDKHGMARCPFHEDHQPSLKLDQRYYCFGCHATGDVIDFTARLILCRLSEGIPHGQFERNLLHGRWVGIRRESAEKEDLRLS